MTPGRAKAFFTDVYNAAKDAERCRVQLQNLKSTAEFGTSHGYGERVSGSGGNAVERRMIGHIVQEERLEQRRDADFALIDRACVVLYGPEQDGSGGLCKAKPRNAQIWADVLWWRYCACAKWDEIATVLRLTVRPLQVHRNTALRWIETNDFMADVIGE